MAEDTAETHPGQPRRGQSRPGQPHHEQSRPGQPRHGQSRPGQPTDPDVDLRVPAQRAELGRAPWPVLGVISLGGAVGSLARFGIGYAFPASPTGFPLATFIVNVSGCLLIGVLMVLIGELWAGRRLVRPFLGVGVLGGFTTFSTYVVDVQRVAQNGAAGTALAYLLVTILAALAAVYLGTRLARLAVGGLETEAR